MFPLGKLVFGKKGVFPKYVLHVSKCQKRSLASDTGTSENYKTIKEIRKELIKLLETDNVYTTNPKSRTHLMKYLVKSQEELPVRKMKDSFDSAIIPLSTNLSLREKYTTFSGHVRMGRLMEDVDLFAVWCAMRHIIGPDIGTGGQPIPHTIVTIHVDHIEVLKSLCKPTSDVRVSGHVCWVGKSSLEVMVWLEQEKHGKWERIMKALLLMAARNPDRTGPAIVNALEAETPEEKALFEGGEKRKLLRMQMVKESLLNKVPSKEELNLVHNLFKDTIDQTDIILNKRILPQNGKWMQDATLSNLVLCHPEYRNLHNKVFGGFLIRQALELSWSTAYVFGMQVPSLVHISDISFYNPVDVGSLLKLKSSITYVENHFIQVFVFAEAFNPSTGSGKSTTSFNFTYDVGRPLSQIYPLTYLEAMKYIDGRRHFQYFMKFIQEGKKS